MQIPRELSAEDRRALVRDYAQRSFVDRGMVADIAFHGGQGENPHAHIMLTTRTLTPEGFGNKNRKWNKKEQLVTWRKDWADRAAGPATGNRPPLRRGRSRSACVVNGRLRHFRATSRSSAIRFKGRGPSRLARATRPAARRAGRASRA